MNQGRSTEHRLAALLAVLLAVLAPGCSNGDGDGPADGGDGGGDGGPDAGADGGDADRGPVDADHHDATTDGSPPTDADESDGGDGDLPDGDPLPLDHLELRGIIHAHTVYSHDGCDENGVPDPECTAQIREAACDLGVDFVALTDHPSNMRDYPFEELLLHDASAGDELVLRDTQPIANRVACEGGHRVMLTVGYEHQHSMPLGLHHHLASPESYLGVTDEVPMSESQAWVDEIRGAGAIAALVHSEQDNISAPYIDEAGFEAMEWHNIHASIEALLGTGAFVTGDALELINTLRSLNGYLAGSDSGAHPDLVGLVLFHLMPPEGFDKWRVIQRGRHITGILGTDVHRNVRVDSVCTGATRLLCEAAAALYPGVLTLLISGGTIVLTDGDRIDSYRRIMSWLENIVLADDVTPEAVAEALRSGRSYGLYTIYGDAPGFRFVARRPDGSLAEMGEEVTAPATFAVRVPERPSPHGSVDFTESAGDSAEVLFQLLHTSPEGTSVVAETTALGSIAEHTVTAPGAYHVEARIRPLHLSDALGTEHPLAEDEYLWIITNPIRVVP